MGKFLERKEVKKALEEAKRLEREAPLSRKEEVDLYRESIQFSEKLKDLLKPSWFVKDVHTRKYKSKKCAVKKKKKKAVKKRTAKKKKR